MSDLPVLTSPLLSAAPGVRHAFFTRQGGVSQGIYTSLNLGQGSRDDPDHVAENRRRAAAEFEVAPESLLVAYQIHSVIVLRAERPWGETRPQGDAVVSATPGLVCGALAADCAPVLLADPRAKVVAAVHAGWRGALGGVVAAAVAEMTALGAEPAAITAVVGPCIGPDSYEVGLEFLDAFLGRDEASARFFRAAESSDKRMFDLPRFVLAQLAAAGIQKAEWIERDTCAEPEVFYSNRRAHHRGEADYGRLLSAIMLE